MQESPDSKKASYIGTLLRQQCPRCRTGNMFKEKNAYRLKHFMKMYERCPVCDQDFEMEVGFYYGTSYVSYALTVALSGVTCVLWWMTIGFSLEDSRFFVWMGANMVMLILAQPYLMRLSRTVWLSFFVRYHPGWREQQAK